MTHNSTRPILLHAFARCGTTLFMHLLRSSEKVLVPGGYPYECRYLSYAMRYSMVPGLTKDKAGVIANYNPDNIQSPSDLPIGPIPYKELMQHGSLDLEKKLFKEVWKVLSNELLLLYKSKAVYYAEKVVLDLADKITESIDGSKSIYLIRDPRAELLSIMDFNRKRGYSAFGWREGDTPLQYAKQMIPSRRAFFKNCSKFSQASGNQLLVRYEDLVLRPLDTLQNLNDYLSLDLSIDILEDAGQEFAQHRTEQDAAKSISKWRNELSSDVINTFSTLMGEQLSSMGYACE